MPQAAEYPNNRAVPTATIANGASLSGAVDLAGCALVGVQMPAGWDAAALTFQGSVDGVTFGNIYDDTGTEYSVTTAAGRCVILDPPDFAAWRWIKIRSGAAAAAVNQTAERVLSLIVRPL